MGLFDNSYFSSSNFGGQGSSLFQMLRDLAEQQGAYNPNSAGFPSPAASPQPAQSPNYGQSSNIQVGSYSMPVFGQPDANSAAMPMNAQPTAGQLPQTSQAQSPSILDNMPDVLSSAGNRLNAGLQGFAEGGAVIPALAGLVNGLVTGKAPQNQTAQALVQRGFDPQLAHIISRDPALLRAVVPQLVGAKDQTEATKNYNLYAAQERASGREPMPFINYQKDLKSAGATRVTQTNQAENSYDKAMGASFAKKYDTLNDSGSKAESTLGTISRMRTAMADPNFYSGKGAEMFALPLKQAIVALGGDPKSAASLEEFRALASKQILEGLGGSLGTGISNTDRDFISGTVANLGNTKEGNEALLNIAEKQARRHIEIADKAQAYVQLHGRLDAGFDREIAAWKKANPLFSETEKAAINAATSKAVPATAVPTKMYNPKTGQMELVR